MIDESTAPILKRVRSGKLGRAVGLAETAHCRDTPASAIRRARFAGGKVAAIATPAFDAKGPRRQDHDAKLLSWSIDTETAFGRHELIDVMVGPHDRARHTMGMDKLSCSASAANSTRRNGGHAAAVGGDGQSAR